MNNNSENIYGKDILYMSNMENAIKENINKLGIKDTTYIDIHEVLRTLKIDIERAAFDQLISDGNIKALDAFDKEFIVDESNYQLLRMHTIKMLNIKFQHPEIPLNETLCHTDIRFSVLYHGLSGKFIDNNKPKIIGVPADIFKFLVGNEYDSSILRTILDCNFKMKYSYVDIFNMVIKLGRNFENKNNLLNMGSEDSNLTAIEYVTKRLNPFNPVKLQQMFIKKFGVEYLNSIKETVAELNIHGNTLIYRIYNGMSDEQAIKLTVEEKNKYKINKQFGISDYSSIKNLFYTLIREHINKK